MTLHEATAKCLDPERARCALDTLRDAFASEHGSATFNAILTDFPLGTAPLLEYLSYAEIAVARIAADPEALIWLTEPAVCTEPRGMGRFRSELRALADETGETTGRGAVSNGFSVLRRMKGREMLRIALRDFAGVAPLEETLRELADLSAFCLETVLKEWLTEMTRRSPCPSTGFTVLGMGKLGGRELNFSSDIDVIYCYNEDGVLAAGRSFHDFFAQLATNITKTFASAHPAGPLFRIDLRLRPEGGSGAIVRSLESMENYYAAMGETWERMALIKARGVCGDAETAYEFLQRLQPFVFPLHIAPDIIDEVAAVKGRIEREIVGSSQLGRHVKLGRGGIREIEFVTQTHQLLHGARHAFLQEPNNLAALERLDRTGLLDRPAVERLAEAYRFLRRVENRLQMENERQTHTLPEPGPRLDRLARTLGFEDGAGLRSQLDTLMAGVRDVFDATVKPATSEPAGPYRCMPVFADPAAAERLLAGLPANSTAGSGPHFAPRMRRVYANLEPLLLKTLAGVADPDSALAGFANFAAAYGARSLLFETLASSPRALELLVKLFDASPFLTRVVLRRPQLIEAFARGGNLGECMTAETYLEGFRRNEENLPPLEWARVYRREQILRIALRDILEFAAMPVLCAEYSALAEAALRFSAEQTGVADSVSVVAMGKFGGREIAYGSDLDIVFIGENDSVARDLSRAMSAQTTEGMLFKLDARLRPEGEASPLILSLEAIAAYYNSPRAQTWEFQALTRARPVLGSHAAAFLEISEVSWRRAGQDPQLFERVRAMERRVAQERADPESRDLKTAPGGLVTIEFSVQALCLRHGVREPHLPTAFERLAAAQAISQDAACELVTNYWLLRRIETVMRRENNESVSRLPTSSEELRKVALRSGFTNADALQERLAQIRARNLQLVDELTS